MVTNEHHNQPNVSEPEQTPQRPVCSCSSRPWLWLIAAVVVVMVIILFSDRLKSPPDTPAITWNHNYQAALEMAKQQNKPLLLAFHASWCPPCNQMKQTTYHDPDVIKAAKAYIPIMVDSDAHKDLATRYQVQEIPAYRILRPDGSTSASFVGYYDPSDFIAKLKSNLPPVTDTVQKIPD